MIPSSHDPRIPTSWLLSCGWKAGMSIAVGLTLAAALLADGENAAPKDPRLREIVWSPGSSSPEFIPTHLLKPDAGPLPIGARTAGRLPFWYRALQEGRPLPAESWAAPDCTDRPGSPKGNDGLWTLLDVIERKDQNEDEVVPGWVALVGTVEEATSGWRSPSGIGTHFSLDVEEVLFDEASLLSQRKSVTFIIGGGRQVVANRVYCYPPEGGRFFPTTGSRVLLIGWTSPEFHGRVLHRFHFKIDGDEIWPQGYTSIDFKEPMSLSSLTGSTSSGS